MENPLRDLLPRWPPREDKRRQLFLDLIEKHYRQIRYGCRIASCKTATCHTYRSNRKSGPPFRRPTPATARAMALTLASGDNPYETLCKNPPSLSSDPSDMALPSLKHTYTLLGNGRAVDKQAGSYLDHFLLQGLQSGRIHPDMPSAWQERKVMNGAEESKLRNTNSIPNKHALCHSHTVQANAPPNLDPKSPIQVLMNTSTWKMAHVVEIRGARYRLIPHVDDRLSTIRMNQIGFMKNVKGWIPKSLVGPLAGRGVKENILMPPVESIPNKDMSDLLAYLDRTTPITCESAPIRCTIEDSTSHALVIASTLDALSRPRGILTLFVGDVCHEEDHPGLATWHVEKIRSFLLPQQVFTSDSSTMLSYLWQSVAAAYDHEGNPQIEAGTSRLDDPEAAHVVNVCMAALISFVPVFRYKFPHDSFTPLQLWESCKNFPEEKIHRPGLLPNASKEMKYSVLNMRWVFEDERCCRLMKRVLRVFASRNYRRREGSDSGRSSASFVECVIKFLESSELHSQVILRWASNSLLKAWDSNPEFSWSSDVGCAVEYIRILYQHRTRLGLTSTDFEMEYLSTRLDMIKMPPAFVQYKASRDRSHFLHFPWLFCRSAILTYFRAVNHAKMFETVRASVSLRTLTALPPGGLRTLLVDRRRQIEDRLDLATRDHLLLNIRRSNILGDALTQLWRRQKKELLRPLKIKMGMEEGEEGQDMGGVTQEFFRLALSEALDPSYGLFASADDTTRMSWFVPCSVAPDHHYFLLGLLAGLAVYNSITLSVTFPLALYRRLLGLPVDSLAHIEDGWPGLTRGFRSLLDFEGNVEDTIMRSYVFVAESCGTTWLADMERNDPWPPVDKRSYMSQSRRDSTSYDGPRPPFVNGNPVPLRRRTNSILDQAGMVTNSNREKYVADYIFWLTDKSIRIQYEQFANGFFLCVDKKALDLFTPENLKTLVEGFQEIDVKELEKAAKYEGGYSRDHPTIKDFWRIVRNFSPEATRKLLEFVTASDRVPGRGVQEIEFAIMKNGRGDQRLPTSSTCFSRLLLPVYTNSEAMEAKLRLAIENSVGFGVL